MRDEMLDFGLWSWARRSSTDDEPLPNVWLGVSIENRRFVHRADLLRQTPAAVRFISAEPLLGPLVASEDAVRVPGGEPWGYNPVWPDGYVGAELGLTGIDWLIVGGESGPHYRPIDPRWVRDLRDACLCSFCRLDHQRAEDCALCGEGSGTTPPRFFFKQWGGRTPKAGGRQLDGRTWDEMPGRRDVSRGIRRPDGPRRVPRGRRRRVGEDTVR
jgi:protein gp37